MSKQPSLLDRVKGNLPSLSLPTLGKTVELPVYVVHNSIDREDYFFIFDFEEFVEKSRDGMFVRPKLKVWAGRNDFDRVRFAGQFRASFAKEFDAARNALTEAKQKKGWGWFSFGMGIEAIATTYSSFVAEIILMTALSASNRLASIFKLPQVFKTKSDFTKLEESIEQTQAKVDEALTRMEIILHRELWAHAYVDDTAGSEDGIDDNAWPLPDSVREHLNDQADWARW